MQDLSFESTTMTFNRQINICKNGNTLKVVVSKGTERNFMKRILMRKEIFFFYAYHSPLKIDWQMTFDLLCNRKLNVIQ